MKWFGYPVLSSLCASVVGILLVVWPEAAVVYLVVTVGIVADCYACFFCQYPDVPFGHFAGVGWICPTDEFHCGAER